jgi:hypothetical protein
MCARNVSSIPMDSFGLSIMSTIFLYFSNESNRLCRFQLAHVRLFLLFVFRGVWCVEFVVLVWTIFFGSRPKRWMDGYLLPPPLP